MYPSRSTTCLHVHAFCPIWQTSLRSSFSTSSSSTRCLRRPRRHVLPVTVCLRHKKHKQPTSSPQPTRVHRAQSHRANVWPWTRARNQRRRAVVRAIEALWIASLRGVTESPIVTAVAELGIRFLRTVSDAIERSLYPDVETELVFDYGITEASPADKYFVDPLREWEISKITYYRDARGRRVYPQLETDGVKTRVFASDYRELADDDLDSFWSRSRADSDHGQEHILEVLSSTNANVLNSTDGDDGREENQDEDNNIEHSPMSPFRYPQR